MIRIGNSEEALAAEWFHRTDFTRPQPNTNNQVRDILSNLRPSRRHVVNNNHSESNQSQVSMANDLFPAYKTVSDILESLREKKWSDELLPLTPTQQFGRKLKVLTFIFFLVCSVNLFSWIFVVNDNPSELEKRGFFFALVAVIYLILGFLLLFILELDFFTQAKPVFINFLETTLTSIAYISKLSYALVFVVIAETVRGNIFFWAIWILFLLTFVYFSQKEVKTKQDREKIFQSIFWLTTIFSFSISILVLDNESEIRFERVAFKFSCILLGAKTIFNFFNTLITPVLQGWSTVTSFLSAVEEVESENVRHEALEVHCFCCTTRTRTVATPLYCLGGVLYLFVILSLILSPLPIAASNFIERNETEIDIEELEELGTIVNFVFWLQIALFGFIFLYFSFMCILVVNDFDDKSEDTDFAEDEEENEFNDEAVIHEVLPRVQHFNTVQRENIPRKKVRNEISEIDYIPELRRKSISEFLTPYLPGPL